MRLLNTITLELRSFKPSEIPPYAILSHRWQAEEVLFEDIINGSAWTKRGYSKVAGACYQATKDGFGYIWIDTCCINKESSAELSEAINSMYAWYGKAGICYAYLTDVPDDGNAREDAEFANSEWFNRGWTLQELVTPQRVVFFASGWTSLGEKMWLWPTLVRITRIDAGVLLGKVDPRSLSVAKRMSWASKRRPEDVAYCLMGLFDMNMPMLYGEGGNAFIRLQEEIMRASDDESLFAWVDEDAHPDALYGLLAKFPAWFANAEYIERSDELYARPPFSMTNKGLHISLPVFHEPHHGVRGNSKPLSVTGHAGLCLRKTIHWGFSWRPRTVKSSIQKSGRTNSYVAMNRLRRYAMYNHYTFAKT